MSEWCWECVCPEKPSCVSFQSPCLAFFFRSDHSGKFTMRLAGEALTLLLTQCGLGESGTSPFQLWPTTFALVSGTGHTYFYTLSLIGLKTRVSKCEDLGHRDSKRREYPGRQPLALQRNLVSSCLLLSWDPVQTSLSKCGFSSALAAYGRPSSSIHWYHQTYLGVIVEMYSLLRTLSHRKGQWEATEGSDQGINRPSIIKYSLKSSPHISQCLLQQGTGWLENWPPTSFFSVLVKSSNIFVPSSWDPMVNVSALTGSTENALYWGSWQWRPLALFREELAAAS